MEVVCYFVVYVVGWIFGGGRGWYDMDEVFDVEIWMWCLIWRYGFVV